MIRPTQFTFLLLIFMPLAVVAGEGLGIGDRVEFSGFGRLVAGYLDEGNDVTFSGYGDSISVDEQSLLGVQLDVKLSDSLSLTSQLLAHSAETRDSGVEWLYLTYEASPRLTFRVGKQRTPFYNYSDVLDVGFAYPWITPPEGVYNEYQISSYDGINARYTSSIGNFVYTIEGYWGSNNEELVAGGDTFEPEFNDLRGIIFNVRMDEWSARASINDARTTLDLPGLQGLVDALSGAGFVNSANSLKANGAPKFYHASLKYENLDWLIEAEYNGVRSDVLIIPSLDGAALTIAYNFCPYTIFISSTYFNADFGEPLNEIPQGVSPLLDQLSGAYNQAFAQLVVDDSRIHSMGLRVDLSHSIAIKLSTSIVDGEEFSRSFFTSAPAEFDRQAVLYQAAMEWVF